MRPPEQLERSTEDLVRLIATDPQLRDHIVAAQPGIQANRYDRDGTSGGGPSDPTCAQALAPTDRSVADLTAHDDAVAAIIHHVGVLYRLHHTYTAPPPGSRKRAEAANEPDCQLCRQAGRPGETRHTTTRFDTVEGPGLPLVADTDVCLSHYNQVRRLGRVTTPDEDAHYARLLEWPRPRTPTA